MNKNIKSAKRERYLQMYEAILTLESVEECINFFDDLCSVTELRAMEQRYQVAKMLLEGHIYSTIIEQTGVSTATISRVSRSLHASDGGYDVVLGRQMDK